MYEYTYNFDVMNVRTTGQDRDRDREGREDAKSPDEDLRCAKLRETWRAFLHTMSMPLNDCRKRSHPRIVPDYSLLVLIACVTNPVLGSLACCLHRHAKHLSHKGKTFRADMMYLAVFGVSLISIGSTLLGVSLVTTYHLIQHFATVNVQRSKPERDCFFREMDDVRRQRLNLTRNDYCRLMQARRKRPDLPFYNISKVIDKTAGEGEERREGKGGRRGRRGGKPVAGTNVQQNLSVVT